MHGEELAAEKQWLTYNVTVKVLKKPSILLPDHVSASCGQSIRYGTGCGLPTPVF